MAADIQPSNWIASWSEDGATISVPLASFGISAANADGTTGDIREIVKGILDTILAAYQTELASSTATEQMVISKKSAVISDGKLSSVYTIKINEDVLTSSVTAE